MPCGSNAGEAFHDAFAIGIGFYAGRQSVPPVPALAESQADAAAARVLDAYVAAHLRATEGVLMTASNSDSAGLLASNRELAASLAACGLETIRARHTCRHRVDELLAILAEIGTTRVQDQLSAREAAQ